MPQTLLEKVKLSLPKDVLAMVVNDPLSDDTMYVIMAEEIVGAHNVVQSS